MSYRVSEGDFKAFIAKGLSAKIEVDRVLNHPNLDKKVNQKPRKKPRHEEDSIHIQCVEWFRRQCKPSLARLLFHIPNGGSRAFRFDASGRRFSPEAQRLKRMGIRSGVSDLFLMFGTARHKGLFVEMKSSTGKVSEDQESFLADAQLEGYATAVCRSLEEFQRVVRGYLA